jgi:hypothetical protein
MQKNFREHFLKFTEMIRNDEHFAFARYSDGELFILQNKELKLDANVIQVGDSKSPGVYQAPDHKHYDPTIHGEFREKLIEAVKFIFSKKKLSMLKKSSKNLQKQMSKLLLLQKILENHLQNGQKKVG